LEHAQSTDKEIRNKFCCGVLQQLEKKHVLAKIVFIEEYILQLRTEITLEYSKARVLGVYGSEVTARIQ